LLAWKGACASLILSDDLPCHCEPGLYQADRVAAAYEATIARAAVDAAGAVAVAAAAVDVAVSAPGLETLLFERLAAGQQHDASTDLVLALARIDCAASVAAAAAAAAAVAAAAAAAVAAVAAADGA
jgi:hypothetical protein